MIFSVPRLASIQSIVPLAFSINSGPAVILQVLLCLQQYGSTVPVKVVLSCSAVTSVLILFVFFYFNDFFRKVIGLNGLKIVKILVGMILLSIAVSIMAKGIVTLATALPHT